MYPVASKLNLIQQAPHSYFAELVVGFKIPLLEKSALVFCILTRSPFDVFHN